MSCPRLGPGESDHPWEGLVVGPAVRMAEASKAHTRNGRIVVAKPSNAKGPAAKKKASKESDHPSRMGAAKPKDVDSYLARLEPGQRKALQVVRQRIHAAQPGLTEAISYGIPFFKLDGKGLVSIGAAKTYCSLYVMSTRFMLENKSLFAGLDVKGVTIRFPEDKPLSAAFVKALVKARVDDLRR
jgi:uncharacterized protein YdhG (YjbR/CyaY superfamily)